MKDSAAFQTLASQTIISIDWLCRVPKKIKEVCRPQQYRPYQGSNLIACLAIPTTCQFKMIMKRRRGSTSLKHNKKLLRGRINLNQKENSNNSIVFLKPFIIFKLIRDEMRFLAIQYKNKVASLLSKVKLSLVRVQNNHLVSLLVPIFYR